MKALDYQSALKTEGVWVPKKGDAVWYHPIINGPAESKHIVMSVFSAADGDMVAFITDKRAYVDIDALTTVLDICTKKICGCCGWWGHMSAYESNTIKRCENDISPFYGKERPANAYQCGQFSISNDYLKWKINAALT
jgi:hypothetical protein